MPGRALLSFVSSGSRSLNESVANIWRRWISDSVLPSSAFWEIGGKKASDQAGLHLIKTPLLLQPQELAPELWQVEGCVLWLSSAWKIYTNLALWFIDLNQFSKEHLQELKDYKSEWVFFLNLLLIWLGKGGWFNPWQSIILLVNRLGEILHIYDKGLQDSPVN